MRKIAALGLAAALVPSFALAAGNHPMAGCGLGYLLLSNKDNSKVTQVLGGITNWTFGTQTFGISSGTSGCTEDGAVKFARATEVFAEVNFEALRRDIAAGQGEYVNAFASLLGAKETNRSQLVGFMKNEYASLFPSAEIDSAGMMQRLSEKLSQHPELLG